MSHLVWLAAILVGAAGLAAAVTRPALTAAAPRLGAVVEVLALAAIGLAPPLLAACAAAALGTWPGGPGDMVAGVCVLAAGPAGPAQLALYGLAATLRPLPGGVTAWVVPSVQAAAWSGGLRHPAGGGHERAAGPAQPRRAGPCWPTRQPTSASATRGSCWPAG